MATKINVEDKFKEDTELSLVGSHKKFEPIFKALKKATIAIVAVVSIMGATSNANAMDWEPDFGEDSYAEITVPSGDVYSDKKDTSLIGGDFQPSKTDNSTVEITLPTRENIADQKSVDEDSDYVAMDWQPGDSKRNPNDIDLEPTVEITLPTRDNIENQRSTDDVVTEVIVDGKKISTIDMSEQEIKDLNLYNTDLDSMTDSLFQLYVETDFDRTEELISLQTNTDKIDEPSSDNIKNILKKYKLKL